jgi:hypothetical protein
VRELENAMERAVALGAWKLARSSTSLPEEVRRATPKPVALLLAVRPLEEIDEECIPSPLQLEAPAATELVS